MRERGHLAQKKKIIERNNECVSTRVGILGTLRQVSEWLRTKSAAVATHLFLCVVVQGYIQV